MTSLFCNQFDFLIQEWLILQYVAPKFSLLHLILCLVQLWLRARTHRKPFFGGAPWQQDDPGSLWTSWPCWTWVCEHQWLRTCSYTTSFIDVWHQVVRVRFWHLDPQQTCTSWGTYSLWRAQSLCPLARRRTCKWQSPSSKGTDEESLNQQDLHRSQQWIFWTFLSRVRVSKSVDCMPHQLILNLR